MARRTSTTDIVGIVTAGLVRLCAILLIVSIIGPWDVIQERRGSAWVTVIYLGEGVYSQKDPTAGWPWILIPLSGVLLFLIMVRPLPFSPAQRWGTMAMAASWFALIALVLLVATDVVQASLGLGDWSSHGLGGVPDPSQTDGSRLSPPPTNGESWTLPSPGVGVLSSHEVVVVASRSGWGWGAALAWWAAVGGLTVCLIDLSRAAMGSRRRRASARWRPA